MFRRRQYRYHAMNDLQYEIEDMLFFLVRMAGHGDPEQLLNESEPEPAPAEDASDESSVDPPVLASASSSSENGAVSTSPMEESAVPQSPTDSAVNTTLASQLAETSVATTSSHSDTSMQVTSSSSSEPSVAGAVASSSSQPSVIVSDIPQPGASNAQGHVPPVIVQDIVDLGNGESVVLPAEGDASKTSQKRKAGDEKDDEEQAPSPKEARREGEENETAGDGVAAGEGAGEGNPVDEGFEEALQQFKKIVNTHRQTPITTTVEQHLRQLPRGVLERMTQQLHILEMEMARFPHHRFANFVPQGPQSDEESDQEAVLQEFRNPRPAKFTLTNQQRLMRILVFGGVVTSRASNSVPHYNNQPNNNAEFASFIRTMIDGGEGEQVVETIRHMSVSGRASRQDLLAYFLAICCRCTDKKTKQAAYAAVQDVCRIPTHIFQLITFIEEGGDTTGWGRGLRKAMCAWYNKNAANPFHLAMHISKYWQRSGWNHRDVFRLSHIKPVNDAIGFIVRYAVKGMKEAEEEYLQDGYLGRAELEKVHKYLKVVEEAKNCQEVDRTVQMVTEHDLLREHLHSSMLNKVEVWAALLPKMPLTALMRNINKMTAVGLFSNEEMKKTAISKLLNAEAMKKARVHPLKLLVAHHMYARGSGEKGSLIWQPDPEITDALEKAFYASFAAVEPTNKRILLALDISGSMDMALPNTPLSVREAATVMAMVTYRTETNCDIVGFSHKLIPLEEFKDRSKKLQTLIETTRNMPFGATDCSKPMTWARKHKKEYDAFIIFTDSETNSHRIPPFASLQNYRDKMNIPSAKLIVVGMVSSFISIADPADLHMLDVVGFDPDTPEIMREFLVGEVE